jgi:hypothetical protein
MDAENRSSRGLHIRKAVQDNDLCLADFDTLKLYRKSEREREREKERVDLKSGNQFFSVDSQQQKTRK